MKNWTLLAATHLAAAGAGYWIAPREMLDSEVKRSGYFFSTVDTKRVLSATVESLRNENKLLVFSFKGSPVVHMERTRWWLIHGEQELIVPATVNYYLDLSKLTLDKVTYDDRAKLVRIELPPLVIGDVAFQPEQARTVNGGLLSWNEAEVEDFRKANYAQARTAVTKQAQGPALVQAAKAQAKSSIQNDFEIPLRIAGQPDVKVVASFAT